MSRRPVVTRRQEAVAAALEAGIPADYHDRAIILAQVIYLLNQHPRIQNAIAFKGGAVLQHVDRSPRYSRDVDATVIVDAVFATPKKIETRWVKEALSTESAKDVVRGLGADVIIANKSLRVPIIRCNAIASTPPVTVSFSVTWREPLLLKPEMAAFTHPTRGTFEVPVLQGVERCAEKIRAFLMRQLCRDAFDLAFYADHVLQPRDLEQLVPLTLDKLSLKEATSQPSPNSDIQQAFNDACQTAGAEWPGADLVIKGPLPTWDTVYGSIQTLSPLFEAQTVPAFHSRRLLPWTATIGERGTVS